MSAETTPVHRTAESDSSVAASASGEGPSVAYACWLSADVVFVMLRGLQTADDRVDAFAECGDTTVRLAGGGLAYRRPASSTSPESLAHALLLRLPPGHTVVDSLPLVLKTGGSEIRLDAQRRRQVTVGLDALLRFELAGLGAETRAEVLSLMVTGPPEEPRSKRGAKRAPKPCCSLGTAQPSLVNQLQLSKSLHAARQALRERLSSCVISPNVPQGLAIDAILAIDERTFYLQGWMHDEQATPTRLTAVSPEGSRTEILPLLYRYRRSDVEHFYGDQFELQSTVKHGWITHLETPVPSMLSGGWILEMSNTAGVALEVSAPDVIRDVSTIRETILRDLHRERLPAHELRAQHIAPSLTRLEERRRSLAHVVSIDQHGQAPVRPDVSIVVPLYGRIDFLEHQLVQFAHDPELQRTDLIYVLDSPDLAEPFRVVSAQLAELYNVPFRAVVLSHNVGFSGVNNIGAELAEGRQLLLLNSDVFPREPGWLSAMTDFYDATPGIGALAPKLLYEDDSIQHAGLYFQRLIETGEWNNEHYYKGLHRSLPAANVARTVPAISAACMMIDLALYRRMGGLRGMYIQGDYEDSDLCLRLLQAGRKSWYLPTVELHHLEGQSYPSPTRQMTGAYNRWLHSHQWSSTISNGFD